MSADAVLVDGCTVSPVTQQRLEIEMLTAYHAAAWGHRDSAEVSIRICEALAGAIEGPWQRVNGHMVETLKSGVARILLAHSRADEAKDFHALKKVTR